MAFLDELKALTDERDELNEWIRRIYAERGVPSYVPLVNVGGNDEELNRLQAVAESLNERETALWKRYPHGGSTE